MHERLRVLSLIHGNDIEGTAHSLLCVLGYHFPDAIKLPSDISREAVRRGLCRQFPACRIVHLTHKGEHGFPFLFLDRVVELLPTTEYIATNERVERPRFPFDFYELLSVSRIHKHGKGNVNQRAESHE